MGETTPRARGMSDPATVTPASIHEGQTLDLAGVSTHVWAADMARAAAVASTLRAAAPATGPPYLAVRFEDGAPPRIPWSGDGPYEILYERPGFVSVRSDLGLVACTMPDRISIFGDAPELTVAFRVVFSGAFAHVLTAHDRFLLHAATLAVDDGCVLVLGPSGAGKSTVALCALRSGWSVLGDDLVVLELNGDHVRATALARPIAAPRDLVDDPRAVPIPGDARARLELPPHTITPGTRSVVGIIVTAHGESPASAVRELPPLSAPPLILTSCLVAESAPARRAVFPLAIALSRLPAVGLEHGTSPETRLDGGAALLEQLRAQIA
jgi:hypothetical protein